MKKDSLYLDTSVPSAYYDARVKGRMEATQRFWYEVLPSYHPYISEIRGITCIWSK